MQVRRLGFGCAAWLALLGPAAVANDSPTPMPSPHPSGTTLVVRPTHAAPGQVFHLTGESDCTIMLGTLFYKDYDGQDQRAAGHDRHAKPNNSIQKFEYAMDIRVPADAAPGQPASADAEPECGPYEDFPPSPIVHLTIDRAKPHLTVSPAGVRRGRAATIRGSGCYGSTTATVPVQVRWPGGGVGLDAHRNADMFTATVTVPASTGLGAGTVTLTDAADCPGSTLPVQSGFQVVATPVVTHSPLSRSPSATATPTASATPSTSPDPTTPPPIVSPTVRPRAHGGSARPAGLFAAAVGLLVAALVSALALRRRRRPAVVDLG